MAKNENREEDKDHEFHVMRSHTNCHIVSINASNCGGCIIKQSTTSNPIIFNSSFHFISHFSFLNSQFKIQQSVTQPISSSNQPNPLSCSCLFFPKALSLLSFCVSFLLIFFPQTSRSRVSKFNVEERKKERNFLPTKQTKKLNNK